MKSIQTKFITLILGIVFLCVLVIGGAGLINSKEAVDTDSVKFMNLQCSERAKTLDGQLNRIKQSVETLALYAGEQIDNAEHLQTDAEYLEEYTKKVEEVALSVANNTEGAVSVYLRYNPEIWSPTSGVFWSKTESNGVFQKQEPTDLSSYNHDDKRHVGWYYIPVKNGKATWLSPYLNQNINVYMISYVIPIYRNNVTIGVVGMDLDFEVLTNMVAGMKVYESGYAFLADKDARIMYHKELPNGASIANADESLVSIAGHLENGTSGGALYSYTWKGNKKEMAFRTLSNGMRLILSVPKSEIDAVKNRLIFQISIAGLCISVISVLLTVIMSRRIIRPLRDLNAAAKKIAEGDLSISLTCDSKDEVGMLANSFQQTVNHLRKYIDYINGLAYRDSLTGARNKTAYDDMVKKLEEKMRHGQAKFALILFDVNGLKQINDNFGHDFGDILIADACGLINRCFKNSPVYRIGGDEFIVVLEDEELEHSQNLLENFEEAIKSNNKSVTTGLEISIARGMAVYNSATDLVFANVFKRADDAMYQNKVAMKRSKSGVKTSLPE